MSEIPSHQPENMTLMLYLALSPLDLAGCQEVGTQHDVGRTGLLIRHNLFYKAYATVLIAFSICR